MARCSETVNDLKLVAAMVIFQATLAGANLFVKVAAFDGMNMRVLIAYRFLFAAIFIDILAIIIERKNRPKLTWLVVGQAFICGLLACTLAQNLYAEGLVLTSATFVSSMFNLVPAVTFLLAISFRLERLGLRTTAGKAKLIGTIVCVGGAMVLTFYKGPELNLWHKTIDLKQMIQHNGHVSKSQQANVGLGAILVICCCLSAAMGLIVQAKMLRNYPCTYSSTALMTTMGAIQTAIFAMCMERSDWSAWKLGWNIRLIVVTYNGVVVSGAAFIIAAWCIKLKGPLYASIFNPLMLVLVVVAGSLVLDEKLHVGSVVGAVVIVCGLYLVLWGKAKELNRIAKLIVPSQSSRKSGGGEEDIMVSGEISRNSLNANSMVGVSSNEIAFICQESTDGDRFSDCDEIREEEKGGELNNTENV